MKNNKHLIPLFHALKRRTYVSAFLMIYDYSDSYVWPARRRRFRVAARKLGGHRFQAGEISKRYASLFVDMNLAH
jgi:hypothetical protein